MNNPDIGSLLSSLIRVNSVNPPGGEREIATLLADWLRMHEVESTIQLLDDGRANLLSRVPGRGTQPALAFCGHLDTVPAGRTGWTHDPFGAEQIDGRMYGRGASDMKSSLAAMAAALVSLRRRATLLACDILLYGTAGEEVDCCGARKLVESHAFENVGALIIGEPTSLEIAVAHKGALWVRVSIAGRMAHGSMPELGSNAILNAYQFLGSLMADRFDVEAHPLLGLPTVSPNLIASGASVNVVPDRCDLTLDIRTVPGMAREAILEDLRELLRSSVPPADFGACKLEVILDRAPLNTKRNSGIVQVADEAYKQVFGNSSAIKGMTYFTDASVIVPATGIPTILLGPGDAAQAHQADECVEISSVLHAKQVYEMIAVRYSQS